MFYYDNHLKFLDDALKVIVNITKNKFLITLTIRAASGFKKK